jgi:hypothetical protein
VEPSDHQGKVRAICHVYAGIDDIERTRKFYAAVLRPLGYKLQHEVKEGPRVVSLGWGLHFPELWTNIPNSGAAQAGRGVHVCFHAPSCESVNEFYRAALAGAEK